MKPNVEMLAACWTTAGDAAPLRGGEWSPHSLEERVEAAAEAGFVGMGFVHADLVRIRQKQGFKAMRRLLDYAGIVHREVEFLVDWWASGERRVRSDKVRKDLLEAAEGIGAQRIKVGPDMQAQPWNLDEWAAAFYSLCDEVKEVGCRVALEFMPFSNLRNLTMGRDVVEAADHPAGGLMIDIWHVERSGTTYAELEALPLRLIAGVELNDAMRDVVGSLWEDTVERRRFCGEGEFDLATFIKSMRNVGWRAPWGVEILSKELRCMPLRVGVARAAKSARAVIEAALSD
jgi:sugar phosphate isomerase/epimerase